MKPLRLTLLVPVLLVVAAGSAFAQAPLAARPPLRGYIIGGAGLNVQAPSTELTLSAEVAENVTRDLQIYVSFSYYENVMSQSARDQLIDVGEELTQITGLPWEFTGRDRARSGTVGAKFLANTGGVRPYVGAGVGVINLKRSVRELRRGVMTDEFLSGFGSADGVFDPAYTNANKPIGEIALGVGGAIGRGYFDVGYRYRRAFRTLGQSFEASHVGAAFGVRF